MVLGAAQCGIVGLLDELSLPMLIDIMERYSSLQSGGKLTPDMGEAKSLTEIVKGGKI